MRNAGLTGIRCAAVGGIMAIALPLVLAPGGQAQAATSPASYTFTQQLSVANTENQQGLAFAGGVHYVGFDLGNGNGRIVGYDGSGNEVARSGVLATGHTNEISVRAADGYLYVTNANATAPVVDVVDMRQSTPAIVRTIKVGSMSQGAVVGVDNANNQLVMATGPTGGPYTLVFTDMAGALLRKVSIPDQGITQGLEVVAGQILLYTSLSNPTRNQITVFSSTGSILRVIPVPVASEGEGLSADPATNELYVGANSPNRVYKMSPAFVPEGPAAPRTITLNPVADTMAREQARKAASGSVTTLQADTQEAANRASRTTPYLRFTVPALAAGESITAASLSLQVTDSTGNGPAIWRTATTWSESTLTWKSGQPARIGTAAVGNFAGMPAGRISTPVSGITATGDVSFQLYAESNDAMLFASRETTTSANRPQLVLTVRTS